MRCMNYGYSADRYKWTHRPRSGYTHFADGVPDPRYPSEFFNSSVDLLVSTKHRRNRLGRIGTLEVPLLRVEDLEPMVKRIHTNG